MIQYAGRVWRSEEFVACIAMDAYRIAMGLKSRTFSSSEVKRWMDAVTSQQRGE